MQDPSTPMHNPKKSSPLSSRGLGLIFIVLWAMSAAFFGLLLMGNSLLGNSLAGVIVVATIHIVAFVTYLILALRSWRHLWWLGLMLCLAMFLISFAAYTLLLPRDIADEDSEYAAGALSDEEFDAELSQPGFFDIGYALTLDVPAQSPDSQTLNPTPVTLTVDQGLSLAQPLMSETDTTPVKVVIKALKIIEGDPKENPDANPNNNTAIGWRLLDLQPVGPRSEIAPANALGFPKGVIADSDQSLIYPIVDLLDVLGDFYGSVSFQLTLEATSTPLQLQSLQPLQKLQNLPQLQYTLEVHTADGAIYTHTVVTQPPPEEATTEPQQTYHTFGPVLEDGAEGTALIKLD